MKNINLKIGGLTCDACTKLISRRFQKINGVNDVIVRLDGMVAITADREIDKTEFQDVLGGTDYVLL